jgi:DMSO/TMAO reductase YedYZ molybdopterin-dependent catalytic subunit
MQTRRQFLQKSGSLALAGWSLTNLPGSLRADDAVTASSLIQGKSDELLILSKDPKVIETPLSLLQQHTITPKSILFVRNNSEPAGSAHTGAASRTGWSVEFSGLVEGDATITAETLASLPQTEYEMVLQCSGNSRGMFSKISPVSGTQWPARGGVGNVRFGGVKLSTVLTHLQRTPVKRAVYVCGEGQDRPSKGDDFEHSVPLGDALESSILALTMNGEPLPAVHGGPVRLVTPGYFGTNHMKWLTRIRFEDAESASEHHADRYRVPHKLLTPGEKFAFNRDNSTPTWKIRLASLLTSHQDQQQVPTGRVEVSGFAWNDGAVPLTAVLVSTNQGETWNTIPFQQAKSLYAWSRWTAQVQIPRGPQSVWVTAVDALGRTQPVDGSVNWNPGGYEWNQIEKITLIGS